MENYRVASIILLALAFLFTQFSFPLLIASLLFLLIPNLIEERKKERYDKDAVKVAFKIASLPILTEARIAEEMKEFEGYRSAYLKYIKTGKLEIPVFGFRSRFLKQIIDIGLLTGNQTIIVKGAEDLSEIDATLAETFSSLSMEKYTLLGALAALSVVIGILSRISSFNMLPYLVFQSVLGALWFRDISRSGLLESFLFVLPLLYFGFKLGMLLG